MPEGASTLVKRELRTNNTRANNDGIMAAHSVPFVKAQVLPALYRQLSTGAALK